MDMVKKLMERVIEVGAIEIRDLSQGEEPFLYSSGNWGPGYVMIKGLVSQRPLLENILMELSKKVYRKTGEKLDFVAGNATGGMVPAWILAKYLERPYVYVRASRKKGGHQDVITGDQQNVLILEGCKALVVEELVNFAETTCASAEKLRKEGYEVKYAATILSYDNPVAHERLKELGVELICLFTLEELIDVAEATGAFSEAAVADYREFLKDPMAWQKKWDLTPQTGGTILEFEIIDTKLYPNKPPAGQAIVNMENVEEQLPILKKKLGIE